MLLFKELQHCLAMFITNYEITLIILKVKLIIYKLLFNKQG